MRYIVLFFLTMPFIVLGQSVSDFYKSQDTFKEESITHRRFKHDDIVGVLNSLSDRFTVKQVGSSVEGRSINLVSYGNGPIKVLLWSQMHGNEPTATMALMDIFRLLDSDDFPDYRELISTELTLHFIPMLNPDGAQRFERRNQQGIDINRDALRQQTPEGRALKRVRDSLNADWGFNLHDQGRATSAGNLPATISFLAPAFNYEREISEKRGNAMQLISVMNQVAQQYVPNQVGRYWDDFEPRAFGDNIQKWGTRTILIESGGLQGDREKQTIRKINYTMLVSAFESIANGSYNQVPVEQYEEIPNNGRGLHDLIIRNVKFDGIVRDVAMRLAERDNDDNTWFHLTGWISDLGDLSTSYAYKEVEAQEFEVSVGKLYGQELETISDYKELNHIELLQQGYTDVIINESFDRSREWTQMNVVSKELMHRIDMGSNPSLVFRKDGKVKMLLINGQIIELK